ncbi:MAG: DinB family protein [Gemmatimonadota bacterium]|nr:DinB family protein [Gemmatimonadota bacterium]
MSIADLILPEYDNEIAITRTVLERVPDGKGDWKPHENAFPLAHLAQLVSMMPAWVPMVTDKPELDIAPVNGPKGGYSVQPTAKLVTDFDNNAKIGRDAIAKMTDAQFNEDWHFKAAGELIFTKSRYQSLRWTVLNHLVHHRAQLGLYLRLVGEKVPEMYGPTADTKKT